MNHWDQWHVIGRISAALCFLFGLLILSGCSESDPRVLFDEGEYKRAFELFTEQSQTGNLEALNYVGLHYYLGLGTKRDFQRAVAAFHTAALAEHTGAQRNLGIMYLRGHGVEQNNHKAYGWLRHAYDGGNEGAREYLLALSDNVTPNASNVANAAVTEEIRRAMAGAAPQP